MAEFYRGSTVFQWLKAHRYLTLFVSGAALIFIAYIFAEQNKQFILSDNTPRILQKATFEARVKAEEKIEIVIALSFRHEADLDALIQKQSDPTSSEYRKFLSPAEFKKRFAPEDKDVEKVIRFLVKKGLTVIDTSPNNLLIHARGTAKQVEKALSVKLNHYSLNGRSIYSNDTNPSLPAEFQGFVRAILGLNDIVQFKSKYRAMHKPLENTPDGFSPQDIAIAYNFPSVLNGKDLSGKGVTIGIASAFSYNPRDVRRYWDHYGIKRTGRVSNVYINGRSREIDNETTLDLQQAGAQAPGADIIMYLARTPAFSNFTLTFNRIVTDNKVDIVSISWGACELNTGEAEMATEHKVFKQGAAQGIAFFAAAGDDGAADCAGEELTVVPDYTSSDPFVTAVGGTALKLKPDKKRDSEVVWESTGGAASTYFNRPNWQSDSSLPVGDKRMTSDVSLVADPATGYATFFDGTWEMGGGTSYSAPAWAGLWALILEAEGKRLGPANPLFYRIGKSQDYNKVFFDIVSGANNDGGRIPGHSATPGWDYPTGWGSPDGVELLNWLKSDSKATSSKPSTMPTSQTEAPDLKTKIDGTSKQ